MDESGARLVHGRAQQWRNLEASFHCARARRASFWWIQGARIHCVLASGPGGHGAGYRNIKDDI